MIVNVASNCRFTEQYDGLQALFAKYENQGFTILAFPSNEFAGSAERGITWNFNKFLINRTGNVVGRYASPTTPEELDDKIKNLL